MKMKKYVFNISLAVLLLWFSSNLAPAAWAMAGTGEFHPPKAIHGIINLTGLDFEKTPPIKLDGEWEFYWDQLLEPGDFRSVLPPKTGFMTVPKSWNGYMANGKTLNGYGYATYRLTIKLKPENKLYGLKVLPMGTAYKLWVNGNLVATNGRVGKNRREATPQYLAREIFFNTQQSQIELLLQISNFHHQKGGFWYSLHFGTAPQIEKSLLRKFWFDLFLIGALFITSIYHFGLYLLRRKECSTLYFGLFCLVVSVRNLTFNEYILTRFFNNFNWELLIKIEYLSLYFILPIALSFFYSCFPEEFSPKILKLFRIFAFTASVFVMITPARIFSYTIDPYLYGMIGAMLYILYALMKAVLKKKEGALIVGLGYTFLLITGINDIIAKFTAVSLGIFFPLGLLVFTFSQTFILSMRFSKAFTTVEALSENLLQYSKELEAKNLQLERVDKIKNDFLANTTHELKTPLHGIIGIAESMLADTPGRNSKEAENLNLIVLSGRRLSNLVNDILDYSKMQHQDIQLYCKPVDIWQITEVVLALLHPLAKAKQLVLKNDIPEKIPLITADEDRLRQIMQNLVGNAIKFTDTGQINVSASVKGDKITISITDTGIGIPEDQLENIFKPFEQINPTGGPGYGGTGLGLSITRKLVEMHNGAISVTSQVGVGSVFTFTIPVAGAMKEKSQSVDEIRAQLKHLLPVPAKIQPVLSRSTESVSTILLADDEPVNLQIIINIMAADGYNIFTAANGLEVLEMIKNGRKPDLLILDIMMPKMSGFEVCRKLREQYSLFELPILIVTARTHTDDILAGLEAGANDYLAKPFDRKELQTRVKTLLELKKAAERAVTAELHFLQSQIKPHFLYNTLNSIIALCRTNPEKAREMLFQLSNYLRHSFDFKAVETFVTLEKELDLVKSYLAIEQERFPGRLRVIYDLDETISLNIPPLILQPLVENAVRHGLLPKVEGGTIRIAVQVLNDHIQLSIEDDGIGIDEAKLAGIFMEKAGTGIGLVNIYKRMNTIYGYGPEIKTVSGKGTTVTLKIPKSKETPT